MSPLGSSFFEQPTLTVARQILGHYLVYEHPQGRLVGRIVEAEGYTQDDPAFIGWGIVDHATGLIMPEGRGYDFFGKPGKAYVYKVYAKHWLLNVVTEREGRGGCVLIRAVEPVEGLSEMYARRPAARRPCDLTSGPGKLTQAFDLDHRFHNVPMDRPPLYLAAGEGAAPAEITTTCRIGLSRGIDLPWRFYITGHPCVSPGVPSDRATRRRGRRF